MQLLLNLLGGVEESLFFLGGLESSVSHLRGSIDEFEDNWLKVLSAGSWVNRLSKNKRSLLGSNAASLNHDVVVLD